jgi:hypothetical protein
LPVSDSISGLIMRDLIYIEEMETKEEGYINWEKMALLAKVFGQISRFQKQKYSYNPQPFIMDYFVDLRSFSLVMNEDELYSLYQKIKPEEGMVALTIKSKFTHAQQMRECPVETQSIKEVAPSPAELADVTAWAATRTRSHLEPNDALAVALILAPR